MIRARRLGSVGNRIHLSSLTAHFAPDRHQVYLDLLERALDDPDIRSIGLTGPYGSGKSSVLRALEHRRSRRITKLSLSTLDPSLAPEVKSENPAERERSNRIQKELVKQLLYQLHPRKTRHSRFPRASRPPWYAGARAAAVGVVMVGLAWLVMTLMGWQAAVNGRLEAVGWSASYFWGGAAVAGLILGIVAWWSFSGRYALHAGLQTGALTVRLEPTSSSYFDQYLDEIMYFFQISGTEVVLIEDVDRFDDVVVFDTLRALNTLVNTSGQVNRRVVFVYAIRDSVLGQIGTKPIAAQRPKMENDRPSEDAVAAEELERGVGHSNRAKYFDLIIPIVPFLTTDNARDLMMSIMKPRVAQHPGQAGISPALIRLAARHVADMRTLKSIRNEYEVHLDRLMTSAHQKSPEITEDIVLALVLLRTTSPETYEHIGLGDSPLDVLTSRWLALVDENLEGQTKTLTDLRTQYENGKSRVSRAQQAAAKLESLRSDLEVMYQPGWTPVSVVFGGVLTDRDLTDTEGWRRISAGEHLRVTIRKRQERGTAGDGVVWLDSKLLGSLLGMSIDEQEWREADLGDLEHKIDEARSEISFLRHHTWSRLYERTDLTVTALPNELMPDTGGSDREDGRLSFRDLVEIYAPTPLARDLIRQGYIPRTFARHASAFYGEVVSLEAAEYIARAIEPGEPIIEAELSDEAIQQILSEQEADHDESEFFDDLSVYNLDLVSYLIRHRRPAAARVSLHLATRWGDVERKFVSRFLRLDDNTRDLDSEEVDQAVILVSLMAAGWKEGLRFAACDAQVTPEVRLRIVNAVLESIVSADREDLDPAVGKYLSENYGELPVIVAPSDDLRAAIVMGTVAAANGYIRDLTELNSNALTAAIRFSVYPITMPNLRALGGGGRVALDTLRSQEGTRPAYDHALRHLADYLRALGELDPSGSPVADPTQFGAVLNDVAGAAPSSSFDRFVKATSPDCRVPVLEESASDIWSELVRNGRTDASFQNVQAYIAEFGLEETMGDFLTARGSIDTPEETPASERLSVVRTILSAREVIPDPTTRAALAQSCQPGRLQIETLTVDDADLIAPMLSLGLLADESATFNPTFLTRWQDLHAAIAASKHFKDFVDSATLPTRFVGQAIRSPGLGDETIEAIVEKLPLLLRDANAEEAGAIALALVERGQVLDRPRIEALRDAGSPQSPLIELIALATDLPLADLRELLSLFGGDYQRLADGGQGLVRFPDDWSHAGILYRLQNVTHTGTREERGGRHAGSLAARLKRPPN